MVHMPTLRVEAERANRDVIEGGCPLCKERLVVHDELGCCPCCGDAYKASSGRLEIRKCALHGRHCQHWAAVWEARG